MRMWDIIMPNDVHNMPVIKLQVLQQLIYTLVHTLCTGVTLLGMHSSQHQDLNMKHIYVALLLLSLPKL